MTRPQRDTLTDPVFFVVSASAHVVFTKYEMYEQECEAIKSYFYDQGISCMTLQPEFLDHHDHNDHSHNNPSDKIASLGATCAFKCENCSPPNTCCAGEISAPS